MIWGYPISRNTHLDCGGLTVHGHPETSTMIDDHHTYHHPVTYQPWFEPVGLTTAIAHLICWCSPVAWLLFSGGRRCARSELPCFSFQNRKTLDYSNQFSYETINHMIAWATLHTQKVLLQLVILVSSHFRHSAVVQLMKTTHSARVLGDWMSFRKCWN